MNIREQLKFALLDPQIEGISVVSLENGESIDRYLAEHSENFYLSEWRFGVGKVCYKYHIHTEEVGRGLQKLFQRGIKGGHPYLTAVYSRGDLVKIVFPKIATAIDNVQIQY